MKAGVESKTKLYAMIGLLSIALLLLLRGFWPSAPAASTLAPSSNLSVPAQPEAANQRGRSKTAPLDPTLQVDLLKNSEGAAYKGSGRNIFEAQAARPVIETKVPVVVENRQKEPPAPALPPPIPLKFFGYANKPGQPKTIFLANGEDVFLAKEGDIVNRRYRIVHIAPLQVEVEDVLNNNRQTIPLTQG
jgi:hypothetical protein